MIVNVGAGDFALEGTRVGDDWDVKQAITYSEEGAEVVPVDASMVWGGDGHEHWHVSRVTSYRLEPLVDATSTQPGSEGREDAKIGFCFFDSGKQLDRGPDKARFGRKGCGHEDSKTFLMGRVVQRNIFGKINFGMYSADGEHIATLKAENWRAWDFRVELWNGLEVARVTKTWEGLARTMLSTADTYVVRVHQPLDEPLRSPVCAVALSIDLALKQDARGLGFGI